MISAKNINLNKNNNAILKDVSFECKPGFITAFIGKSGAGKTSALRCIAGLETDYTGEVLIDNTEVRTLSPRFKAEKIGFVAQNYNLFPNMTVLENCTLALLLAQRKSGKTANDEAILVLEQMGMSKYQKQYPKELSGGQKQRVAIARALSLKPRVLVLDEPSSALDPENVAILAKILGELRQSNMTVILSSQDMNLVGNIADITLCFDDGKNSGQTWR